MVADMGSNRRTYVAYISRLWTVKKNDFIGSQGEFAELCWEKNGGREMRKMIRLLNATPGERLGWIVGLRRHLSALKVNPGGQRCHVLVFLY